MEGPRHYLVCEAYGGASNEPMDQDVARAKVGPELFQRSGQLPWVVLAQVARLTRAFRAGDAAQVAFASAILSHYVADLCVPLHTSSQGGGPGTDPHGLRGRWEDTLLKRMLAQSAWVPAVHLATLGQDPQHAPWAWLQSSHERVPRVLSDDLAAKTADGVGAEPPGPRYWEVFQRLEEPVLQEQLTLAAQHTAQRSLLAWTRAGSPPFEMAINR
jgi:hypothetical protein